MKLSPYSFRERYQSIQKMSTEKFDLLIIGGGINGAGIAREACLRGMKVALVEARDYAEGTSSRSSKLIHGGVRYLENLEFHLVFEALNERSKLLEMAPHLVHPLRFLIPIFEESRVSFFKMKLGLWLYDLLALFKSPESHEVLSKKDILSEYPWLKQEGLKGGLRYSDAYMDDDRLVFETLRSAHQTNNLTSANYVKVIELLGGSSGQVKRVKVKDQWDQREFEIKADQIVSAVGPWTDELRARFDQKGQAVLRPTKGVHLTFLRERFPLKSAVVMGVEERIVFAIPRHEMVIVGTTDTDYKNSPQEVSVALDDVQYLLEVLNSYFPKAHLTQEDIIGSYAGVRPLVKDDSATEGKTSREHSIWTESNEVTYVSGGKYTTYRLISEEVIKKILPFYSYEKQVQWLRSKSYSSLNPLVTDEFIKNKNELISNLLNQCSWLEKNEAEWLVDRYGQEALCFKEQFGDKSYYEYEVLYAVRNTSCLSLKDFYFRRTPFVLSRPDHGLSLLPIILPIWKSLFSLSEEDLTAQVDELKKEIAISVNWKNSFP